MKRGRPAIKGIDNATAIARRRGCVMRVMYAPDSVCDLVIRTAMLVIFVRVVRFERIVAPVSEIEHDCRGILAELRLFPQSPQIRHELWIYSKHGTYRCFRLTEAGGLEEIRQDGEAVMTLAATGETPPAPEPGAGDTGEQAPDGSPAETPAKITPSDGPGTLPGEGISCPDPPVGAPSVDFLDPEGSRNNPPKTGD